MVDELSDLPSLDSVMKGFEGMTDEDKGGKDKDKGDDDFGFDLDTKPFSRFADGDDDQLENDPARKKADNEDVVFEVAEEDDYLDGDDDDFKDNRKPKDKKKDNRLQREMRLKAEARETASKLTTHVDRIASDTTKAMRLEMHGRRTLAEVVKSQAHQNLARFEQDLRVAQENGDMSAMTNITRQQAEANDVILKADALISRYSKEAVDQFVYDPKVPEELRNPTGGATTKGADWVDANSSWFKNPDKYGGEIAYSRAIDEQLVKEGKLQPNTDEYFNELTRRVALRFRDLEVYTTDGRVARVGERQRGGGQQQRRDTTGSSTASGGNQTRVPQNGKRETINSEEMKFLKGFGIDTSNKDHLAALKANRMK